MELTPRAQRWAATMQGHGALETAEPIRVAHPGAEHLVGMAAPLDRQQREDAEHRTLAPGATRAVGAGTRLRPEAPDPLRTCFERDRDRILHSPAFRRLAGKTQVFVFPDDHQRTRLTHALEVAQVATAMARACGLNVALTEAIALGHDCGHGPGGHASEDALSTFLPEGYDHAVWGADVVVADLNLCAETLDGIRNHSWSRPAPATPEGAVVSWADRCAYSAHDLEDAVHAGIVSTAMLPALVAERCGTGRSQQLRSFIDGVVSAVMSSGRVGMVEPMADALAELRRFNYEHIYLRPASVEQSDAVIRVLRALVDHFADRPHAIPTDDYDGDGVPAGLPIGAPAGLPSGVRVGMPAGAGGVDPCSFDPHSFDPRTVDAGSDAAVRAAVTYVAGMTDRYAFRTAVAVLGWNPAALPRGVGV